MINLRKLLPAMLTTLCLLAFISTGYAIGIFNRCYGEFVNRSGKTVKLTIAATHGAFYVAAYGPSTLSCTSGSSGGVPFTCTMTPNAWFNFFMNPTRGKASVNLTISLGNQSAKTYLNATSCNHVSGSAGDLPGVCASSVCINSAGAFDGKIFDKN